MHAHRPTPGPISVGHRTAAPEEDGRRGEEPEQSGIVPLCAAWEPCREMGRAGRAAGPLLALP
jgi:hypothetical protein